MTVVVTGLTAERMIEMEEATVIDGDVVGNNLILHTRGGDDIDTGNVRGPTGATGAAGTNGTNGAGDFICTSGTRPASPVEGYSIYETDTDLRRTWTGTRWKVQEYIICTSSTRPAGLGANDEGTRIFETDTDLHRTWTGTAWKAQERILCTSSTRPTTLLSTDEGVRIYETDTNSEWVWTGTAWTRPAAALGMKVSRVKVGDSPNVSGAATVITGLSITLTAEANRIYQLVVTPRIMGNSNGDQGTMRVQLGGVNFSGAQSVTCTTTLRAYGGTYNYLMTGLSAGAQAITVTLQLNNGTSVYVADAAEIYVLDIGPA